LKIAAKTLHIEAWLPLTAYKKSPALCPMVPSQTLYDFMYFIYNTPRLAYRSALWLFKVIQDQRFSCHLKANMRLSVSDQLQKLNSISHRSAIIHLWQTTTDRRHIVP